MHSSKNITYRTIYCHFN